MRARPSAPSCWFPSPTSTPERSTTPLADAGVFVADDLDGWHYRSYSELAGLAYRIGGALRANGLRTGGNACIVMPSGHRCVAAMYAVWLCGATVTQIAPPTFGSDATCIETISAILRSADPRSVLTSPELLPTVERAVRVAGLSREPLPLTEDLINAADPIGRAHAGANARCCSSLRGRPAPTRGDGQLGQPCREPAIDHQDDRLAIG